MDCDPACPGAVLGAGAQLQRARPDGPAPGPRSGHPDGGARFAPHPAGDSPGRLSREERLIHTAGLFRADADYAAGRRVLLLDDVLTTGATTAACARALTAAGAESVAVVGFAASRQNRTLPAVPGVPFDLDAEPDDIEDF